MTYTEISKILIEHHKAYKRAVKLTKEEENLLNDYAADLDMDIEEEFEKKIIMLQKLQQLKEKKYKDMKCHCIKGRCDMEEKKLTDEQLIHDLEEFASDIDMKETGIYTKILDLIHRLQSENAELKQK